MGFLSRFFGCSDSTPVPPPVAATVYEQADVYKGMRSRVFGLKPEMIGLPGTSNAPLAALMEMGHDDEVYTLVCVADGAASLYFSTGGGVIGGGQHEPVRAASLSMLKRAAESASQLVPTETYPLPLRNTVRFYLISADGIRTAEATEQDIKSGTHHLHSLFLAGHDVIARIRENTPEQ